MIAIGFPKESQIPVFLKRFNLDTKEVCAKSVAES
jgi:hypothetical protein